MEERYLSERDAAWDRVRPQPRPQGHAVHQAAVARQKLPPRGLLPPIPKTIHERRARRRSVLLSWHNPSHAADAFHGHDICP